MRSLLLISLLCLAGMATAEEVADPPGRVARLSYTQGEVSLAPAGTEEWAEAVLNRPLTSGDRVWVDKGGRAELQVGSATVHLDENTGLSIVDLDDDVLHLEVTEGSANVRLLRRSDSERVEIDTPNSIVEVLHPGEYRIEVNGAGDQTIVRTRNGGAEVKAGSKTWRVDASEEGVFDGVDEKEIAARIEPLGPRTAFEDWANDRNRISENPVATRYVSNEVVGYEDLDRHGYWVNEPSYGYVWQPTYVVSGWAPYRYGRWVWVSPWGWSWVDNSPWGFAPFHYGRWAYVRSRWCWVPGPRHIRPVYAPALVAWTGSPGVSVTVGFGSGVGWFPLGPREVYVPGYRYSRRYFNNVNVSNTVIVNNTYINNFYYGRPRNFDYMYGRDGRAVTIVDRDRFTGGRPIDNHWTRVDQTDLRRWHHDSRPPAIAPNRDSVFASRTLGRIPDRRNQAARDLVAQRSSGGLNQRIPFDAEQRAIEANGGRPIGRSQLMANNANRPPKESTRSHDQHESGHEPGRGQDSWRSRGGPDRPQAVTSDRPPAASSRAVREGAVSDRPSWVHDRQRDRIAPPVKSLQQQNNAGNRVTQQPSWRGNAEQRLQRGGQDEESIRPQHRPENRSGSQIERVPDARDVFRDQAARQREERAQRTWSNPQLQSRPERLQQQPRFEQPRSQPQPRVEQPRPQSRYEQPRSQPRPEQPRIERSSPQPAARPQASQSNINQGGNRSGNSSRSQSGNRDRPSFRPQ